jgi:hypothetical protein
VTRWVLLAACLFAVAAAAPDWSASVAGLYVGRQWNAGQMQCERTEFSVRDGALVGHYWIDDAQPFEGELTGFVPDGGRSGTFTWTDRYGVGVMYVRFAGDGTSFWSMWGLNEPDTGKTGYGLRGEAAPVPGCGAPPVS